MARLQCNTCQGTYDTELSDGTRYFHACPPLSEAEVETAIGAGMIARPTGKAFDTYKAQVLALPLPNPTDDRIAAQFLLLTTTYERAEKRDENVPSTSARDAGKLKALGKGATPIAAPAPVVVVVE